MDILRRGVWRREVPIRLAVCRLDAEPRDRYLSLPGPRVLVGSPATPIITGVTVTAGCLGALAVSYLYFWRSHEEHGNV